MRFIQTASNDLGGHRGTLLKYPMLILQFIFATWKLHQILGFLGLLMISQNSKSTLMQLIFANWKLHQILGFLDLLSNDFAK